MAEVPLSGTRMAGICMIRSRAGKDVRIYGILGIISLGVKSKTYCSWPSLSVNVFKQSSSGILACGLDVIRGRKPPVSLFLGTCSNDSCGFERFFGAVVKRDFEAVGACIPVSIALLLGHLIHTFSPLGLNRLTTPVYSSRLVSAFSSKLSMTSTTPFQLPSMASTSGSFGPTASELAAAFSKRRCAS